MKGRFLPMTVSAFDLCPILMKKYDFFGYVMIDDRRYERVLSDETHRILTRILNHYVANNKPSYLTSMVEKIRDDIVSNSNIYPMAWIYRPYQYAINFCQTEIDGFKSMLKEVHEKAEDPFLIDYVRWLLEDPFVDISLKVCDVKNLKLKRGLIIKEEVMIEEASPVPDFSCNLIDPFDNHLWKVYTNDSGCCEFKVIPVLDSKSGKRNYRIFTGKEMIEFDPLIVQKIELAFTNRGRQINLIGAESNSEWLTACPICNKEVWKASKIKCPICKLNVCRKCMTEEGFLKKRSMCKSCKKQNK